MFGILGGKMLFDTEYREAPLAMHVYSRLLGTYYKTLMSPFMEFEKLQPAITVAYTNTLHAIRPAKAPAFAFTWISLLTDREYIDRMLVRRNGSYDWKVGFDRRLAARVR